MSRHKKRMHKKVGKFQDRFGDRKARVNSKKARYGQSGKAAQKSRHRKTTYMIR